MPFAAALFPRLSLFRLASSLAQRGRRLQRLALSAALVCLAAATAQSGAQSIQTANLGANQVTLELTSPTTGTGYFTLLLGSSATCGTATQTAAGEDSNGNVAINGSLPLTANAQGQYTVRDLAGSTAYTVCFTPDGTTVPVSANIATAAQAVYSPGAWEAVGNLGFTPGTASPSLAFAPDGTPYVAFADGGNGNKASVMQFNGSAWVNVGSAGFSPGIASGLSLAFAPDGTPYVAFEDNANNEAATVMMFNGSTWVMVGNAGFTPGAVTYGVRLAFAPDGAPYVAFNDPTDNKEASVMMFNGTSWVYVGAADFSPGEAFIGSLAFAPGGAPYVVFEDGANGFGPTVMEFNGTSWAILGLAGFSPGQATGEKLAFGPDGTPYVAFLDAANADKVTVKEYDSSLSAWVTVGSADFSPGADAVSLAIGADGMPYVAIEDLSNNYAASAMEYNGTSWVNAGNADFSAGATDNEVLAIAPDGTPYVGFEDAASLGAATVMRLTSAVQATVTTWPAATPITYGQTLAASTLSGGAASVAGTFAWVAPTIALSTGAQSGNVVFTPNDTADYAPVFGSVSVTVNPAVTTITTAPTASALTQGEALSDSTLSGGVASVPGTFAWTSPSTVMSTAGNIGESATFTPNDSFDYTTVTLNVTVQVFSAAPAFTNVGANQVTLELASEYGNFGYFTLLQGNNATCGTPAQTAQGQDSNGNMVINGSMYLTGEVQALYTVRNLMAATAYTACFTLDGATGPVSSSFVTAASAVYSSPTWTVVGTADISPGQAIEQSLAFAPDGTPYVAFIDVANNDAVTVMEFNGTAWVNVGSADFSPGAASNESLAFAPDGTPFVAFADWANGGNVTVMQFNGTAWVNVGTADFSPGSAGYVSLAFAPNGAPYVAFQDAANNYGASVMAFLYDSWVNIGSAGFSPGQADTVSIAFAPNGTPYVAFGDDTNQDEATVMEFNGASWVTVGSADFTIGLTEYESLAIAPNGTPYVASAYEVGGPNYGEAEVYEFDGTAWGPVGSILFSQGQTEYESMAIGADGTPYVAFQDYANNLGATVMEFNGTSWVTVGSAGFSPGGTSSGAAYESLAFAPDGTPYVAFADGYDAVHGTTVMKLTGAVVQSTPTITTWPSPSPITYGQTLAASTLSGGSASVAGTFAWTNSTLAPGAGVQNESVTFTPADTTDYTIVSGSVNVTVNQAAAVVLMPPAASSILTGQALSASLLSGGSASVPGSFAWTAPSTVVASPGSTSYAVTFTPADSIDYTTATTTSSVLAIQVTQSTANLGAGQVTLEFTSSATATGSFIFLPGAGATCDSAVQVAVGVNRIGNAVVHGSLPLTANVQGQYTVRNLAANTAYTVCFTPDGSTGPASSSFTTAAQAVYNPGAWANVGNADFSPGRALNESLAFAPDGTPYVAFGDNPHQDKATVMEFNGTSWVTVGNADFSPGEADSLSLAFAPNGAPYVAFADETNGESATVMEFNGTSWVTVGNADFSPATTFTEDVTLAFAPNGAPYVAFSDFSNNGAATVMEFNGTAWVTVGSADFSPGEAYYESLAFAPDGTPYVAFEDEANNDEATVMEFNGTSWVNVGNADFSPGATLSESLAFAPNGTPYVAFQDNANNEKATVMEFNGTAWVNVGNAGFSPGGAFTESLAFTPNGTPYLAFEDNTNDNNATVMEFNGTAWVTVGSADFSPAQADYISLVVAPDGTPYVAFADGANNHAATVMRLATSVQTVPTITAWPSPSPITYGQMLSASTLSGGSASVAGAFAWTNSSTAPGAGVQSESVIFTPTDTTDYTSVTGNVNVTVNQATPAITTPPTASSIQAGQMLSASMLSSGAASVPGAFAWTSPSTVVTASGSFSVTFTPADSVDYTTATTMVSVVAIQATQGTIATANLGANQVTLQLTSTATGTGYFTLLPGSNATCGSATQTAAGEDSNGNVAINGSLPLTANTQGQYTVRNLMGSTAYTVCFTPDGSTGPVSASFTTAAQAVYSPAAWANVGNADFSPGGASYESLAFAPDGAPYVAFQDNANGDGNKATVMEFNGSAWVTVGSADFSAGVADDPTLAFAPDGAPYVAFADSSNGGKATVMEFIGGNWVTVGSADFSPGAASQGSLAFAPGGEPYVAFIDAANGYAATVMEFNGSAWVTVGSADFSPGTVGTLSLAFAPNGTPYLAFEDNPNDSKATVMQFNGSAWVTVGSADFSPGSSDYESLAIAPDGTPYVAFQDYANNGAATVMEFNGTAWVTVGSAGFSPGSAGSLSLAFAPDGAPYVAFVDSSNGGKATVMEFIGSNWVNVGSAGFSPGVAIYESLAFAPDGTPYVAFQDDANGNAATVMRLTTAVQTAPTITTWPNPSPITYGQTLADSTLSGGSASVAGTFAWTNSSTAPGAGAQSEPVTFTPTDTTDYTTVTGSVTVTVNQATPAVTTWPAAGAITYGQTLANSTLSGGNASVSGSFAFTTPATAPGIGTASQSVTFTPTDTTDYTTVSGTVSVTVNVATPAVTTWPTASSITYGQTLASSTLSGGNASVSGSFAFTTPATAPGAGTVSESVTFTPSDATDYSTVTGTVSVTVNKATPTVTTWPTASSITYGQTLASSTLSGGSASVAGGFTFTTPATAPVAGSGSQSVTFTPSDITDYNTVTGSVNVTVNKASQTINFTAPASPIVYGSAATVALTATSGSSENPVTFSVTSGPGTVSGTTLTITGTGTIEIAANQAGDANYTAASQVTQALVVNSASVTLAGPSSQPVLVVYGSASSIQVSVAGQFSGAGITPPAGSVGYSILNSSGSSVGSGTAPIVSGTATIPVAGTLAAGSYTVDATYSGDSNYKASAAPLAIVLQVGEIQPIVQITAPGATMTYGSALGISATATYNGNSVAGSFSFTATLSGGAAIAVTAATVLPAGSYTLTASFTPTDAITYKAASNSASLTVTQAMPAIVLTSSANPILADNAITLTAVVSSAISTPTGSVTFFDGATSLGMVSLSGGTATLNVSTLAAGAQSLTAVYSGDSNFVSVTSTPVNEQVYDFALNVSSSGGSSTAQTVLPGGTATFTFTASPVGTSTFPAAVLFSVSGLPNGANSMFTPGSITAGANATTMTLTVTAPAQTAQLRESGDRLAPLALALLLLPFSRRLRRRALQQLALLLLAIAALAGTLGLVGCGSSTGIFAQPQQTYGLTITGTSGTLTHSATVQLTVE